MVLLAVHHHRTGRPSPILFHTTNAAAMPADNHSNTKREAFFDVMKRTIVFAKCNCRSVTWPSAIFSLSQARLTSSTLYQRIVAISTMERNNEMPCVFERTKNRHFIVSKSLDRSPSIALFHHV